MIIKYKFYNSIIIALYNAIIKCKRASFTRCEYINELKNNCKDTIAMKTTKIKQAIKKIENYLCRASLISNVSVAPVSTWNMYSIFGPVTGLRCFRRSGPSGHPFYYGMILASGVPLSKVARLSPTENFCFSFSSTILAPTWPSKKIFFRWENNYLRSVSPRAAPIVSSIGAVPHVSHRSRGRPPSNEYASISGSYFPPLCLQILFDLSLKKFRPFATDIIQITVRLGVLSQSPPQEYFSSCSYTPTLRPEIFFNFLCSRCPTERNYQWISSLSDPLANYRPRRYHCQSKTKTTLPNFEIKKNYYFSL